MLRPKKTKFLKPQKRRIKIKHSIILFTKKYSIVKVRLVSLQSFRLKDSQLESLCFTILKKLKKGSSKLRISIFPDLAKTKKPNQVRMGKGKGSLDYWASNVKSGTSLLEIMGSSLKKGREAVICGSKKLPIKTSTQIIKNG